MLAFTPLAGSGRSEQTRPLCYLLTIDDVNILLDCGSFPPGTPADKTEAYYSSLKQHAPNVDLVLFSHGDTAHLGLYPYAHAKWKLAAPAYASIPVQAMGRMAVTEELKDLSLEQQVLPPTDTSEEGEEPHTEKYVATPHQILEAFEAVSTLRYSEPIHLGGKCQGITITPYSAGHTLGGTIWKIRSPSSGTIVYAVDMNHTKERHLDGTVILRASTGGGVFEGLARPDLLITDADRALTVSARRKDRDTAFLDLITTTIRTSHSVLIPCDPSTRILELLVLLDQYWSFQKLDTPICLVSQTGQEMLAYVRSMVEWMGGTVSKDEGGVEIDTSKTGRKRRRDEEEDEGAVGPMSLRFRHVQFFNDGRSFLSAHRTEEPKVILAVPYNMAYGPSRKIFTDLASDAGNLVVLPSIAEPGTLSHDLFTMWNERQSEADKWGKGKVGDVARVRDELTIKLNSKVPLTGQELEDYNTREQERVAKEREAVQRAALARSQQLLEADEGDSGDDTDESEDEDEMAIDRALRGGSEDDMDQDADPVAKRRDSARHLSFDIYLKGNVSKAASFFKTTSGATQRFRMYPYVEKGGMKRKVDEYGESLDVGMWLRRGRALDEDAESEEVKEAKRKKREEEEAKKAPPEPPSKFVSEEVQVRVDCQLAFIDLEGLNDGRAVKTIVPQVNPRRMIIVHAPDEATDALVQSCASIRAMTHDIYTPGVGDTVTIGQRTNTFSIALADSLLASLKLSKFEDSEMAFLSGKVPARGSSSIPVLEPLSSTSHPLRLATPQEDEAKNTRFSVAPLPRTTMIGDLKLAALRSRLTALGLSAEFAGEGVLLCSGGGVGDLEQTVAVKKTGRGKISVEGSTGDVYFTVRDEIYALHAVVSQP
ncbi:hypothetical protein M407DRAFT_211516 [Tulasnella calospora MUT 4182]|uniref:Cleavage and polyadenylation specificity factor subunit 2 n=1 Tax=Tulasnella calospora MUT 4182 TaxID=1051891 RepID=A0A0C3QK48_9AGAM|nr:hypothetical protein M407DRAFT_211516 [Tulasnella calospora MUT 4182]